MQDVLPLTSPSMGEDMVRMKLYSTTSASSAGHPSKLESLLVRRGNYYDDATSFMNAVLFISFSNTYLT